MTNPMNNELRKQVKLLKALQGISYKEIAGYLGIRPDSLSAWLRGNYDFSEKRLSMLQDIITNLKEK